MRPPRFRLRTLMIAVAVAGFAFGGEITRRRWTFYRERAASFALTERDYREYIDQVERTGWTTWPGNCEGGWLAPAERAKVIRFYRGRLRWFGAKRRQYELAASRPWTPPPPDPPPPVPLRPEGPELRSYRLINHRPMMP